MSSPKTVKPDEEQKADQIEDRKPNGEGYITLTKATTAERLLKDLDDVLGTGKRRVEWMHCVIVESDDDDDTEWIKSLLLLLDGVYATKAIIRCDGSCANAIRRLYCYFPIPPTCIEVVTGEVDALTLEMLFSGSMFVRVELNGVYEPFPELFLWLPRIPSFASKLDKICFENCLSLTDDVVADICRDRRMVHVQIDNCEKVKGTFLTSLLKSSRFSLLCLQTPVPAGGITTISRFLNVVQLGLDLKDCTDDGDPLTNLPLLGITARHANLSVANTLVRHPTLGCLQLFQSTVSHEARLILHDMWRCRVVDFSPFS
jgi:hypothetical protein